METKKTDEVLANILETVSAGAMFTDYGNSDPKHGSCDPPCAGQYGNKVGPNEDFYARGDARVPTKRKIRKHKKKVVKESLDDLFGDMNMNSDLNYPTEFSLQETPKAVSGMIRHNMNNTISELHEDDQNRVAKWKRSQIEKRVSEYFNSFDDRNERMGMSDIHTAIWIPQHREKDYHSPLQLKLKFFPYSESDIKTYAKEFDPDEF